MVAQTTLLSDLQSLVGEHNARAPEKDEYNVDRVRPQAVIEPANYEEVAAVLRYASSQRLAVIPRGGGAHIHIGNVPSQHDIALSLTRLNRVIEHEPADLTVVCQAGIEVADLQKHLGAHGQFAPFDGYLPPQASVGGSLASSASGGSRHALGTPRDFTIGMRVVMSDGRIVKAGGKVVKNVAGYDMCKLFIGSAGSLVVIVEATLKVMPVPIDSRKQSLRFHDVDDAYAFAAQIIREGLSVRSLVLMNSEEASGYYGELPEPSAVLAVEFAGTSAAVERSYGQAMALANNLQADTLYTHVEVLASLTTPYYSALTCRISVRPTEVAGTMRDIQQAVPGAGIIAQPITGSIRVACPDTTSAPHDLTTLRRAASARNGTLVVESSYLPELKRQIDVFGELPPKTLDLMRRVKQQFDPNGILSPGRFVGRL